MVLNYLAPMILSGIALETLWLLSYRLAPLRAHSGSFVALMLVIFVVSFWSFFRCPLHDGKSVRIMLGFALLFRLTVLPAHPDQSEDVYRYLWDGRLTAMGVDPYRFPPNAPELESFRDDRIYPKLNSKPYVTAYPPFSQALFYATYRIFGVSVTAMKAVFCLFEFASLLLAWRILVSVGASLQPLFLLAWNPFFIFEFSHSGHSDSSMMFLMLLAIYLIHRSQKIPAGIAYGAAILAKLHPALWLPVFLRQAGWKATGAALSVGSAGAFLWLAPDTWIPYLKSLRLYLRLFEFNAGLHYLLRFAGHTMFNEAWDKLTGPYLAAVLVIITILITLRFPVRNALDLLHAGFWIMTADLCLATTVHPWYLSWAALALPFLPNAFMTYWTGACMLSYLAYGTHPVYEPAWALLLEYVPMFALMAWEIRRGAPALQDGRLRIFR